MQGAEVQSLVGERGSCMPCSMVKKRKWYSEFIHRLIALALNTWWWQKREKKKNWERKKFKKKREKLLFFFFLYCLPGDTPGSLQLLSAPSLSAPEPCSLLPLGSPRETEKGAKKSRGCPWSPGCLSLCPDTPLGPPLTFAQLPAVKMTHRSKDTSSGILNHG